MYLPFLMLVRSMMLDVPSNIFLPVFFSLDFFIGLSGIAQTEQEIACHYTADGRLVLEKEVNGAGLVGIDTGGLASGIYSV